MLLLYITEKERWVVSAFTSTRNTFLSLKAANLTKIMNAKLMLSGDAIISYIVTSPSSSLGAADDARSNDARLSAMSGLASNPANRQIA